MHDPEPAKKETPAAEKPDDATKKKTDQDAAKKAKEDADEKADDVAAQKAEDDAARQKAEAKREEDLNTQMTQPLFMLTQAGVQFMKDNPDLGKNVKLIYIPGLYYESMEVLL